MLSSPGDMYVKKLTYTLYCGGVCGGGGAIKALLGCGIAVPEIFGAIRKDSR